MPEEPNLEEIKKLVKLVEEHQLAEITVEEGSLIITVKGAADVVQPAAHAEPTSPQPTAVTQHAPAPEPTHEATPENIVKIEAPMVGVFYRSPSPDMPPFVEVGDTIEVGQTIGLIEAMKVFSEIPSEVAGEVVDIPAQNVKLVQQGETLVVVRVP